MAAASVLTTPQYGIVYPPLDEIATLPNVVTTNIAAYQDSTNTKYDLRVGASSNIVAQAVNNIFLEHGATDEIVVSAASGSNLTPYLSIGLSNNRVTLVDTQQAGLTFDTKNTYLGSAHFVEDATKLQLSMPNLSEGLLVSPAVAMQSTLAVALDTSLNQNLFVTGDTGMGGRLVTYGGIFTPDMALYRASSNHGAAQVGFSFKINNSDQLELIKYTFFGDSTSAVSRRVACFGTASLNAVDTSDVSYSASRITGTSGTSGSGSSNAGAPGFDSATTAFTVSSGGTMYTQNTLAIGTSNVNPDLSLQVVGTTQSTSFVAEQDMSSPVFLTTSDARLKDIQASINGADALSAIMALSPLTYSWKSDATHSVHAGLTAQDVGSNMPLAVHMSRLSTLEDALHIDNTALLAYLVAAVKELGARITA